MTSVLEPSQAAAVLQQLRTHIAEQVVGQHTLIEDMLVTVLAGGHALIEGNPGLGKTRLVKTFAALSHLKFGRVQFTPDLMPSDITGTNVIQEGEGIRLEFEAGAIFCNVLLADEINRATPKTQSALLEAMQEGAVTIAGTRHLLPRPFVVLATQNPLEMEGTYPLPEAQLDRFLMKLQMPRPDAASLRHILELTTGAAETEASPVLSRAQLLAMQESLRNIVIASSGLEWVVRLIEASHSHPLLRLGASPRGGQAMVLAAKGYALLAGRPNVEMSDLARAALPTLRHRLMRSFEAEMEQRTNDSIIRDLLRDI